MASRLPIRRISASFIRNGNHSHLSACLSNRLSGRRNAALATAQAVEAASEGSNLSETLRREIIREASLPTPDPSADSQSHRLVAEQVPYLVATYVRPPPVFISGSGCYLYDVENRRYLDLTAGIAVNALGHSDPEMSRVLAQQSKTLIHTSNLYHNPWTGSLSRLLIDSTRDSSAFRTASRVFISNSGSEANEAALKFARKSGRMLHPPSDPTAPSPKHEIVSFTSSFHGRTFGSLSATPNPKYQAPFSPMVPGFKYGTFNDIPSLSTLITPATCGVIIEPIQGEGGVHVATPDFLHALRKRCDEVGALLIFDEIQCGLSRTGEMWAHAGLSDAHPDILTTAKALGNGYPIGATLVSEEVATRIQTGDHGTTFGGSPLACKVGHYVVSRLIEPELQQNVRDRSAQFVHHLQNLQKRWPSVIREIRGKGLLLGVQLDRSPTDLVTACRERGLLIITCGTNTLRIVPPLVITAEEVNEAMRILGDAMSEVLD